ncbi:unnamed protein product [Dibothriocephalus latus]|uniref:Endonuclease/exonuclease/phosphatase domain-containing protein n=1 Tax=Dibothriocephalus latus TaxID=60516 RepID=A0A3P7MCQ3_DIBLA|nr:unnamed protein product [Dibothriocephalus latus]
MMRAKIPDSDAQEIKVAGADFNFILYRNDPHDSSGRHGVAITLSQQASRAILAQEPANERMIHVRLKVFIRNIFVFAVCAITTAADRRDKEMFCSQLKILLERLPRRDLRIVAGNWNGRTGPHDSTNGHLIGRIGFASQCENEAHLSSVPKMPRDVANIRQSNTTEALSRDIRSRFTTRADRETIGKVFSLSDSFLEVNGGVIADNATKVERWREHYEYLLNFDRETTAPPAPIYNRASPSLTYPVSCDRLSDNWGSCILVPVPKNGNKTRYGSYRGISLINIAAKIFAIVLLGRFQSVRNSRTRYNQARFRAGRGCVDQLFTLRRILEFRHSYQQLSALPSLSLCSILSVVTSDGG